MTEKEKMLNGEVYYIPDEELVAAHARSMKLCREYNDIDPLDTEKMDQRIRHLIHTDGKITVKQPFMSDYGSNIYAGNNVFINYGCYFLDVCDIRIGDNVLIAPNVQLYAAAHPVEPENRRNHEGLGAPITIEDDVWIGGGAILCPGVTIGAGSMIGAGSVVTKDIPPHSVAAGNPCKVIRKV
ncbi:MAG: sugar O-acetyltransferase [Christensenellaceae bacterium]